MVSRIMVLLSCYVAMVSGMMVLLYCCVAMAPDMMVLLSCCAGFRDDGQSGVSQRNSSHQHQAAALH